MSQNYTTSACYRLTFCGLPTVIYERFNPPDESAVESRWIPRLSKTSRIVASRL
jgi:hypothetical protein